MRILFVSKDLSSGDLAYRLQNEGNDVRVFVNDKDQHCNLAGIIKKTTDWKKELNWVDKDGLIVFDSTGYGKTQDALRNEGYSVVGGSYGGDQLEDVRQYGQKILTTCGIKMVPSICLNSCKKAIEFLQKNEGPWVIKQNGHISKLFNYVGRMKNNADAISVLKNYNKNNKKECTQIDIQKKISGIEIGVARYFNGNDWVGPIEINLEHKDLFNGNLGPKTYEMGTLMWYDDNEKNRLFNETLAKLKPFLTKSNFRGDIDINCIVNEKGTHPLEVTARFGFPAMQLQCEIHKSPMGEFLKAVADGKKYDLKYKKGYGIIALVATPPFPYEVRSRKLHPIGMDIFFKKDMTEKDMRHIHFEEASLRKGKKEKQYYVSSKTGYVLHVSETGKTVEEAREKTYNLIKNIVIPKMFYRTDIGEKFIKEDEKKLREWGWI